MDIRKVIREEVGKIFEIESSSTEGVVADSDGKPIKFYHGSKSDFETFDKNKIGSNTDPGWLGEGFYFYDNPHDAGQYGYVKSYFLKLDNPYYATDEENERLAELNSEEASREFSDDLKMQGYDGVYYNGNMRGETVVFEPNQIVYAGEGDIMEELDKITLKSKSDVGNRRFKMLKNAEYHHYSMPRSEMSPYTGGEEDRKNVVSKLSKADKKIYRAWLKTPEGKESIKLFQSQTRNGKETDIRQLVREELQVIFESNSNSFFSKLRELMAPNGNLGHFKTRDIKGWPDVPPYDGPEDELGTLDLENNEYLSLDSKKLCIVTGGDWQDSWYVEIVNAPGGLKVGKYGLAKEMGGYKKLTKQSDRMKEAEITEVMYSDHPMHKSFENFVKEVKSNLRKYSPWGNSYGDEHYEEEIIEGPKFDKDESVAHVTWYIGGHDNKKDEVGYKDMTHEARTEERFQKWVKDRVWCGKKEKVSIKGKDYKIKSSMESLGEDKVKYSIEIQEK